MKDKLTVPCEKQSLSVIREYVLDKLNFFQVGEVLANQIVLAVDETCANSIIHGNQVNANHNLEIKVYKEQNELHIDIYDPAPAFDINQYTPTINLEEKIKNRSKGGFGIALIKKIMDRIDVETGEKFSVYKLVKILQ
ncbi:MAG: ATP-binding protein [Bacteroidia bacterium]|nr:ATP-binding protein [Bacteroidia bacterium]